MSKTLLVFLLCVLWTAKADPASEVKGILIRLLGAEGAELFDVTVDAGIAVDEKDTFVLRKEDDEDKVSVIGSSGVAAAWGVHHYLTEYCGAHISWDGDQLALPEQLPGVDLKITSLDRYKYYQNVCTSSYSFVWWDWPRWEREIDWMALKGINLALAFGGQEAIWRRVFDGLGVTIDNFTGPAFLAWGRMGNIRAFGNGLDEKWHEKSVALQHRILDRMRALGITPVLPAFNGILPPSFLDVYPSVNGTRISRWNNFPDEYCCPFLLDPADPLFITISRIFLREYIAEFGTDHIYNSDTFNENNPSSNDVEYLAATGRTLFEGILEADPAAIWMVQGWMFLDAFWGKEQVKAFVTSVPIGRMLILDLQSDLTPFYEKFESYYGQPFIWCTLHNFGGQLGLYGHLNKVNKEMIRGRTFSNSTMVGVGITPEGIDQNFIMYEFTLQGTLASSERNLTNWVVDYARKRYGFLDAHVEQAWQILLQTVYDYDLTKVHSRKWRKGITAYADHIAKNVLVKFPSLRLNEITWYDRKEVFNAFQLMIKAADTNPSVNSSQLFAHDIVDVTRQIVQLAVGVLYQKLVSNYNEGNQEAFGEASQTFISLLDNLDVVLKTNKKFLLGSWLEDAKAAAQSDSESEQFEWNARNQITLWGPKGEIRDYAAKQWSGMISDFYKPRWQMFFNALNDSFTGVPYNRTAVNDDMLNNVEIPFTKARNLYPIVPEPDSIGTVLKFNQTWGEKLEEIFQPHFVPIVDFVKNKRQKVL